jgi:GAF domain-containing protein
MSNDDLSSTDGQLAEELVRLVQAIAAGSRAVLPASNDALLESIASAAARIFGAEAATIFLVDEDQESLVFRVTAGPNPHEVKGLKISIDKGIAGYVAMTGQSIAVSNTEQDARFYASFAKSTGYVPKSILATPLHSGERVIGVMEILDKIDASSFGLQDMEMMGLFAQQASLAIEQSRQLDHVGEALIAGLQQLAAGEGLPDSGPLMQALEEARRPSAEMDDLLALAGLFHDLSKLGSQERLAAIKILLAMAELGQSKRNVIKKMRLGG